jgi:hypothetical protein
MSEALWAAFGFIIASAIWFSLFSVSYKNWYRRSTEQQATIFSLDEKVTHLKGIVHPEEWLDESDVAVNIAKKERLYDRHPDLVRPGSEVLIITSELEEDNK